MKIEAGQYWLTRRDDVVLVQQEGHNEYWVVNRVTPQGEVAQSVGVFATIFTE